jgi:hypothetical protein
MADSKVADMGLAEFVHKELSLAQIEMPGIMAAREEFGLSQPLKGIDGKGSIDGDKSGKDEGKGDMKGEVEGLIESVKGKGFNGEDLVKDADKVKGEGEDQVKGEDLVKGEGAVELKGIKGEVMGIKGYADALVLGKGSAVSNRDVLNLAREVANVNEGANDSEVASA